MRTRRKNTLSKEAIIDYTPLLKELGSRRMSKTDLRKSVGLSTTAIVSISKGNPIPMESLLKICKYLECDVPDVMRIHSL